MPLESAIYVNQLVVTNPDGAVDTKNTLDDHLRLIKTTLRMTFANFGGAITATHTEANYLVGVTSAIQTQLNTLTTAAAAKMPLAGGTFTGAPIWATAPSAASHLANKQYVDGAYSAAGVAQSTANNAQATANNATTAAGAAQGTANTAVANAAAAQSTANTGVSNAAAAQSTANTANSNASSALSQLANYLLNLQGSNSAVRGYAIYIQTTLTTYTIPAGGTWFYCVSIFNSSGLIANGAGGFVAGGTVIGTPGFTLIGFAIRVS